MQKYLAKLSLLSCLIGYSIMIVMTHLGTGENLSFTTFALWSMLDSIVAIAMYKKRIDPSIPIVYGGGATLVAFILLFKGRCSWSNMDSIVSVLVIVCLILWKIKGPKWANLMATTAAAISGIPFLYITWKNPDSSPIIPNVVFLIANVLQLLSVKEWSVEKVFFPTVNIVFCFTFVLPWLLSPTRCW